MSPRPLRTPSHRGGAGDPLMLVHGFTDTWSTWKPLLPRLEPHHDVFAPTLPGHLGGISVTPGEPISDVLFADFLERQLDELGLERVHLAGNSLGGWLALELAARGRALSVTAICPAGGWYPHTREDWLVALYFQRNALLMKTGDWWIDAFAARRRLRRFGTRELVAPSTPLSATDAREMFEGAAGCEIIHRTLAVARRDTLFGDFGPIDCPVRVLYGSQDKILRWPRYFARLRALLPDVEYVALPGMRHLAMWDDPAAVTEHILELTERGRLAGRRSA